jgi:dTDP-4-dehydrorhamnose 3,5-epimerase
MKIFKPNIDGVVLIEPYLIKDERGYFFESFNQERFEEIVGKVLFVQDNESKSSKGVLRGLHFQKPPYSQAKLVRCTYGKILDVIVDIRKKSSTYGKTFSVELSEKNKKQIFIPRGFAHGFIVLSKHAKILYKVDNKFAPEFESGIRWNDKQLNINWGLSEKDILISEKDSKLNLFKELKNPFN